jgi:hypothetical protein
VVTLYLIRLYRQVAVVVMGVVPMQVYLAEEAQPQMRRLHRLVVGAVVAAVAEVAAVVHKGMVGLNQGQLLEVVAQVYQAQLQVHLLHMVAAGKVLQVQQ